MGRAQLRHRDVPHEPDETRRRRVNWSLVIAILSLVVSALTFFWTRNDISNANRAKRERAEYLSYRLGVDVGLCAGGAQYEGVPSLAPATALARDCFRTSLKAIGGDLGLDLEIPESLDKIAIERIKMRIHDTCGKRAVDSYVLGVDLGLAEGVLLPWAGAANAAHSSPTAWGATFSQVVEPTKLANRQLEILGFQQRLQLDNKSGASSFDRLNELDRALRSAWDSRAGRWRR